jgi:hypothetical protein
MTIGGAENPWPINYWQTLIGQKLFIRIGPINADHTTLHEGILESFQGPENPGEPYLLYLKGQKNPIYYNPGNLDSAIHTLFINNN